MELEQAVDDDLQSVDVTVNHIPVRLPKRKTTGLQIKEAAIAQGVSIDLDFVLSRRHGKKSENIGDDQELKAHEGEEFSAVAPDDNS